MVFRSFREPARGCRHRQRASRSLRAVENTRVRAWRKHGFRAFVVEARVNEKMGAVKRASKDARAKVDCFKGVMYFRKYE